MDHDTDNEDNNMQNTFVCAFSKLNKQRIRLSKMAAEGEAGEREAAVLRDAGLSGDAFAGFGKLLQGTRRHGLVYVDDVGVTAEPDGLRLTFTLPAGSYATVLLREVMKADVDGDEDGRE